MEIRRSGEQIIAHSEEVLKKAEFNLETILEKPNKQFLMLYFRMPNLEVKAPIALFFASSIPRLMAH